MEWQQYVEDVAGEVLDDGRMAYPVVCLIVPRRAGKTLSTLARSIQRCAAIPAGRSWYTAQTGSDARLTFVEEWLPLVTRSRLAPAVRTRLSNGSESMTLTRNRSRLGLFAPTDKALHGQDADHVVVDEAWSFTDLKGTTLEAAFRPAMVTRKRRQLWIVSAGGTDESTWLLRYRELGRALGVRPDQGLAYFEWHPAVDDAGDPVDDLDDPAVWAATHPAVGRTIDLDALKADRATMPDDVFRRSYLNVFQSSQGARLVPESSWNACRDLELVLEPAPGMALAYDVELDRSSGSIVLARELAGRRVVELVDQLPEHLLADRVERLARRYRARLVANGAGPVSSTTRTLRDRGLDVDELDAREYADACGELLRDVMDGRLAHRGQPPLDAAAAVAGRRELGDSWAFTRKGSAGAVAPLLAAAVAAHATRRPAGRAPVIELAGATRASA